jgi:hypothetical protein
MNLEEDNDPARLDEGEPSELGRFVRAARSRGPSTLVSARMAERLAPARAAAATASSSRVGPLGRTFGMTFGGLALVALGGAFVASSMGRSEHAATPGEPVVAPAVSAPPEAPLPVTGDLPTMPVDALPSSSATPASASASAPLRIAGARPAPSPEKPRRADEFELIQRAQDKLASEPARALAILQEHARLFPTGELTQERETMAVEALVRMHRIPEARTRANALLARFPRTPYVARLESALGEPLSVAPPVSTPR